MEVETQWGFVVPLVTLPCNSRVWIMRFLSEFSFIPEVVYFKTPSSARCEFSRCAHQYFSEFSLCPRFCFSPNLMFMYIKSLNITVIVCISMRKYSLFLFFLTEFYFRINIKIIIWSWIYYFYLNIKITNWKLKWIDKKIHPLLVSWNICSFAFGMHMYIIRIPNKTSVDLLK